jgi:hypothetical protein
MRGETMYLTIRRYQGVNNEAIRKLTEGRSESEGVVGLVSEMPGFVAYYLVDAGDGQMLAISVYLGEMEAQVSTQTALEWVQQNLSSAIPATPEVIGGDVIVHRVK